MPHAANWFYSGRAPRLLGSAHPNICPYDKFSAGDGEIFLAVANDGQFRKLCECIDRPDLAADPRFATNASRVEHRAALRAELERTLATHHGGTALPGSDARGRSRWTRPHRAAGVRAGACRASRNASWPMATTAASAHRSNSRVRRRAARASPRDSAQHADEILAEAGYTIEQIAELRRKDVVRERPLQRRVQPSTRRSTP